MSSPDPDSRGERATPPVLVVAAVVVDDVDAPTRVLAARRAGPPALAGRWEFPGGKVEPGEDPLTALHRELAEELDITVNLQDELLNPYAPRWPISHDLEMRLWFATVTTGTPQVTGSHDELRWLGPDGLDDVAWLPADVAVAAELRGRLSGLPAGDDPQQRCSRAGDDPRAPRNNGVHERGTTPSPPQPR